MAAARRRGRRLAYRAPAAPGSRRMAKGQPILAHARLRTGEHVFIGCSGFATLCPLVARPKTRPARLREAAETKVIRRDAVSYFFRSAALFVAAAMRCVETEASVDGQFFIAPALNEPILGGRTVVAERSPAPPRRAWRASGGARACRRAGVLGPVACGVRRAARRPSAPPAARGSASTAPSRLAARSAYPSERLPAARAPLHHCARRVSRVREERARPGRDRRHLASVRGRPGPPTACGSAAPAARASRRVAIRWLPAGRRRASFITVAKNGWAWARRAAVVAAGGVACSCVPA
jgi:hypothetical protein